MNEDRIIKELIDIKAMVSEIAPLKAEFHEFKSFVTDTLDHHTVLLERLDQERLVSHAQYMRLEADVEMLKSQRK